MHWVCHFGQQIHAVVQIVCGVAVSIGLAQNIVKRIICICNAGFCCNLGKERRSSEDNRLETIF
jgi:hypothetical protein